MGVLLKFRLCRRSVRQPAQSGAILPLFLILLVPILAIIGLAVDTGMVLSSKNNLSLIAQNAALASLSEYLGGVLKVAGSEGIPAGTPQSVINEAAVEAAVKRAEQIAGLNRTRPTNTLKHTLVTSRLKDKYNPIEQFGMTTDDSSAQKEGTLEIGKYYFKDADHEWDGKCTTLGTPPSTSNCTSEESGGGECDVWRCKPCTAMGLPGKSCFLQAQPTESQNTAVRFTIKVDPDNQLRTVFLRLLGIQQTKFNVTAIATLIPRNDIFLMDLSTSMYRETHLTRGTFSDLADPICDGTTDPSCSPAIFPVPGDEADPNSRSEFVYVADHANPAYSFTANGSLAVNVCGNFDTDGDGIDVDCDVNDDSADRFSVPSDTYDSQFTPEDEMKVTGDQSSWDQMLESRSATPGAPSYQNFRNEYRFFRQTFSTSKPGIVFPSQFFIHWHAGGGAVPKAEPLFGMISAVHHGMDILKTRSLGSDSLGVYGFDSEGRDPSGEALEVSARPRYFDPVPPAMKFPEFSSFYAATNMDAINWRGTSFLNKGLFPLPGYPSDVGGALVKGLNKISLSKTYLIAKNSIFLFTDGLANCPRRTDLTGTNPAFPLIHGPDGEWSCNNVGPHVIEAINGIIDDEFINEFKKRRISVSIALIGSGSQPHFIARASGAHYGCVTQSEASRESGINFFVNSGLDDGTCTPSGAANPCVEWPSWEQHNERDYGQQVGDMKAPIYRAPNELYRLVRDTEGLWIPIMPAAYAAGDPDPIDFEGDLEEACEAVKGGPASSLTCAIPAGTDNVLRNCSINGVRVIDDFGRVIFDPKGRTPGDQMKDAMNKVLSSPFMLVD